MRKRNLWLYLAVGLISAMILFGCSQHSPLTPGDLVSTPVGETPDNNGGAIPGEYIVVLKSGPSQGHAKLMAADVLSVAALAGVNPRNVYTTALSGFSGELTDAQYQALQNDPSVDHIEPNRTIHILAQNVSWGISHIAAPQAHARGVKGGAVKVGVIDTGMDYLHPDLAANYVGGIDFVNGDNDPMDDHGHGTHVAGIIAAVDNTIGVLGVAPAVSLYGVKVLAANGSGSYASIIAGIDWCAANGIQVINMSLGGPIGSQAMQAACDNATAAGVVVVAAAGNSYGAVGYPAAYPSCIAVSAVDQFNNLAVFSSRGPEVDVTAPGVGVISTYRFDGYASLSGTSMASPHVAGVCALIVSTGNYPTAGAVRNQLLATCTDLGTPGLDDNFGFGLINADAATQTGGGGNLLPIANANGPYIGDIGTLVTFSSAGSSDPDGSIVSYLWDFGDGTAISTLANPTHAYSFGGTYTLSLTVTDNLGATGTSTTTASITGNKAPVAKANGPYNGLAGKPVVFSSAGSNDPDGTIVSYMWYFGDGGTSTLANPTYTYELPAWPPWDVALVVTDNSGAKDTTFTTATILRENVMPVAKANGGYTSPAGILIQFSSAGSGDRDGTIVSYAWSFGDGGTSALPNPTHAYTAGGAYTVSLTVTDDRGGICTDITSAEILAVGGDNLPPVAKANGPYNCCSAGQVISFSSNGSADADGTIAGYEWSFGDGLTSTLANPTHVYARAGIYTVILTVADNLGAKGSENTSATVTNGANVAPVANANGPYSGATGTAVSFSSAGSSDLDGVITSYAWNFGDGATSALANPTHAYATAGTYNVSLTVTDNVGATGSGTASVSITAGGGGNLPPVASVNGPYSGTAGTAVSLSSAGSSDPDGTIASYTWNFGDGTAASTLANPTHVYTAAGTYTVSLTVTDNLGATSTSNTTASIAAGGGGVDVVTITKAEYKVSQMQLIIRAKSDRQPSPTLTVVGYGTMTWKPTKGLYELTQIIATAPASVTVTSSLGGSATKAVLLQ